MVLGGFSYGFFFVVGLGVLLDVVGGRFFCGFYAVFFV